MFTDNMTGLHLIVLDLRYNITASQIVRYISTQIDSNITSMLPFGEEHNSRIILNPTDAVMRIKLHTASDTDNCALYASICEQENFEEHFGIAKDRVRAYLNMAKNSDYDFVLIMLSEYGK